MDPQIYKWQKKLLPWMVILPTVLIVLFVILATSQLRSFNQEIEAYRDSELDKVFRDPKTDNLTVDTAINKGEFMKLYMLARMDEQLMNKRYSQAGVLLLSRLYIKYLGFFTGMILAIVGAVFIIAKLSEQETKLEASSESLKFSLISASPGIIFGILGTALMMTTILKHNGIDVKDVATYMRPEMFINVPHPTKTKVDSLMEYSSPYPKQ